MWLRGGPWRMPPGTTGAGPRPSLSGRDACSLADGPGSRAGSGGKIGGTEEAGGRNHVRSQEKKTGWPLLLLTLSLLTPLLVTSGEMMR